MEKFPAIDSQSYCYVLTPILFYYVIIRDKLSVISGRTWGKCKRGARIGVQYAQIICIRFIEIGLNYKKRKTGVAATRVRSETSLRKCEGKQIVLK
jgi:hypothetical protein